MIYAELCFGSPSSEFVDDVVRQFGLTYQEIPRRGFFRAAIAFGAYKSRKGTKTKVLTDFFIGGHAEIAEIPVLTRDTKRLRVYFPRAELMCPEQDNPD